MESGMWIASFTFTLDVPITPTFPAMQSSTGSACAIAILTSDDLPLEMKYQIAFFLDQQTLVFMLEVLLNLPLSQRDPILQEVLATVLKSQQKWNTRLTTIYSRVLSDDYCTGCGKKKVLCPPDWSRWRRCVACLQGDERVDLWTTTEIRDYEKKNNLEKESLVALTTRCGRMRAHINHPFSFMYRPNHRTRTQLKSTRDGSGITTHII